MDVYSVDSVAKTEINLICLEESCQEGRHASAILDVAGLVVHWQYNSIFTETICHRLGSRW